MDIDQQLEAAQASPQIAHGAFPWSAAEDQALTTTPLDERLRGRRLHTLASRGALMLLDAVMLNFAFLAAYYIRYVLLRGVTVTTAFVNEPLIKFQELQIVITLGMLGILQLKGLYRLRPTGTWFKQFWMIVSATTIAFAALSAFDFVFREQDLFVGQARAIVALSWVAIITVVSFGRLITSIALSTLYRRGIGLTNVLIVGSGRLGKLMMQHIAATPNLGYQVVGFIHDLDGPPADFGRFKVLGVMRDLDRVIRQHQVGEVIIALPSRQHQAIMAIVRACERAGADFKVVPDLHELSLSRIDVDAIEGIPLIGLKRNAATSWHRRIKRVMDVTGAGLLLVITAPVWALTALAIKLDSPGPVFYRQERIGYRGRPFACLKFRSMHENADSELDMVRTVDPADERGKFKLRDDPRCTLVGRFIRRSSIDELPQMLNVLAGDMSLVGPRPPLPAEVAHYEEWEKARLEVPPGMTGLWQVRGRSEIVFDEMVLMDLYYIENWSLRLDMQILLSTIPAVLRRRGAY